MRVGFELCFIKSKKYRGGREKRGTSGKKGERESKIEKPLCGATWCTVKGGATGSEPEC